MREPSETASLPLDAPGAETPGRHAVVIGGSMAGLLAARVLADHFDRVTVIERDALPDEPALRKGVPQARHVHVLLAQGHRALERLFPGLAAELLAAGAIHVDMIADFPLLSLGGWTRRLPSDLTITACTRHLLEWSVRRRLAARPALRFLSESQVTGLLADPGRRRVTGVSLRHRNASHDDAPTGTPDAELRADLVVDAGGRTSRAPQWLEALGYTAPTETVVNSFLGYATRWYRRPTDSSRDWQGLVIASKAPFTRRGGVIFPVEDGQWLVTLTGVGRDYPPTDEAAFLDFARSLRSPALYEAIKDAQPLTPVYGYQRTENRWRHYERLSRRPEGFVLLGDAVCAFNPVYGQGMTAAALGALALDDCLRTQGRRQGHDLTGLAARFQQRLAKVNATPWLMATGEDFRWATTEGGKPSAITRLMHRYIDEVLYLSAQSGQVYQAFGQVTHLVAPPATLFQPHVLTRVLRHAASRPRTRDAVERFAPLPPLRFAPQAPRP